MFLSPLAAVRKAAAVGYLGDLNPLPFPMTLANCAGWICYGLLTQDTYVLLANELGFLLGMFYTLTAVGLSDPKLFGSIGLPDLRCDLQPDSAWLLRCTPEHRGGSVRDAHIILAALAAERNERGERILVGCLWTGCSRLIYLGAKWHRDALGPAVADSVPHFPQEDLPTAAAAKPAL
ncbi:hypothetical protein WJX72_000111 [[Myrmecia] bisecta]|uniref:Uncharacterized protein n=1 Tax=[Myrmecia] bisecta TaxID=41462 RepID=A0AAW1Q4A8_9CHLO